MTTEHLEEISTLVVEKRKPFVVQTLRVQVRENPLRPSQGTAARSSPLDICFQEPPEKPVLLGHRRILGQSPRRLDGIDKPAIVKGVIDLFEHGRTRTEEWPLVILDLIALEHPQPELGRKSGFRPRESCGPHLSHRRAARVIVAVAGSAQEDEVLLHRLSALLEGE